MKNNYFDTGRLHCSRIINPVKLKTNETYRMRWENMVSCCVELHP